MSEESRFVRQPHGPGKTYYNRLASASITGSPVLGCVCGWLPQEISDSWEQSGRMLDQHINGALKKEAVDYAEAMKGKAATARR